MVVNNLVGNNLVNQINGFMLRDVEGYTWFIIPYNIIQPLKLDHYQPGITSTYQRGSHNRHSFKQTMRSANPSLSLLASKSSRWTSQLETKTTIRSYTWCTKSGQPDHSANTPQTTISVLNPPKNNQTSSVCLLTTGYFIFLRYFPWKSNNIKTIVPWKCWNKNPL